jgi:hypothetical protein
MIKKALALCLITLVLVAVRLADAQQPGKVHRIGYPSLRHGMEQSSKVELIIYLKTAKQIGVTIPQSVLYRADKVIK